MWLNVSDLLCLIPYLHDNIRFYKVAFLKTHLLGCVLVLAQVLNERGAFWGVKGGVPIYLPRARNSNKGWYGALIW